VIGATKKGGRLYARAFAFAAILPIALIIAGCSNFSRLQTQSAAPSLIADMSPAELREHQRILAA
jgi:hypothetical protein